MNDPTSLQSRQEKSIAELGPWFHNLHLPGGVQTAPDQPYGDFPRFKWEQIAPHLPEDLSGWTALDIGCNAGFYSFELAKRGAQVTAIDLDEHYLAQARWAAGQLGLEGKVRFERMQVYDLARRDEKYDLILFMGVFYHLRYPLLALDTVAQKVQRLLVFQSLTTNPDQTEEPPSVFDAPMVDREILTALSWPKMSFIEHRFCHDPTNWWVPNVPAMRAMLRSAGMRIVKEPAPEVFLAEPHPTEPSCVTTWNEPEYLSALGRPWYRDV